MGSAQAVMGVEATEAERTGVVATEEGSTEAAEETVVGRRAPLVGNSAVEEWEAVETAGAGEEAEATAKEAGGLAADWVGVDSAAGKTKCTGCPRTAWC